MAILVVGSVGYDTVETPAGSREDALGGSATFFSISSSYFAPVGMVAVVGEDFTTASVDVLKAHRVDVSGLQRAPGKTFRWSGVYGREDVNSRETLDTQLNVFADFDPRLSPEHRTLPYLFLANIDPELQLNVLGQMDRRPKLVAADTMNFWIDGKLEALNEVVRSVDVLFVDENEIRQFAAAHVGGVNVVRAARFIQNMGPETVIVKRGDHGLIQFMGDSIFAAPAYPLDTVVDPTGAGDSFAGGFIGYLAGAGELGPGAFRRAAVVGSVMGSFAVESFSVERLSALHRTEIAARFRDFSNISQFEGLKGAETLPWRDGAPPL
jgi:sugar/nucleoside kinase (ribokinase family)